MVYWIPEPLFQLVDQVDARLLARLQRGECASRTLQYSFDFYYGRRLDRLERDEFQVAAVAQVSGDGRVASSVAGLVVPRVLFSSLDFDQESLTCKATTLGNNESKLDSKF